MLSFPPFIIKLLTQIISNKMHRTTGLLIHKIFDAAFGIVHFQGEVSVCEFWTVEEEMDQISDSFPCRYYTVFGGFAIGDYFSVFLPGGY